MKRAIAFWILAVVGLIGLTLIFVRHRSVLNSGELQASINDQLPPGTPKTKVIEFIRARKPVACDDLGLQVKARISGLAPNMIYHKDIVLTFQFDDKGKLLSFSRQETLTFF